MKKTVALIAILAVMFLFAGCNTQSEFDQAEYEAYIAVMKILEQDATNCLEANTNYALVCISEFGCYYIEPEPDASTVNPDLNAPHYLSYICIIEENGKIGSMSFGFNISKYVDTFADLKTEMDKGVEPKTNYTRELPKYKHDNDIYDIVSPHFADGVTPYLEYNQDLEIFNKNKVPKIILSISREQTIRDNEDVTAFFMILYFSDVENGFSPHRILRSARSIL